MGCHPSRVVRIGHCGNVNVSRRLRRQISHDFPGFEDEVERQLGLAESGGQDRERVLAAIVFTASGDLERLENAVELSHQDWRDVLLGSGLAGEDWPAVLDARLGPITP